MPIATLTSKGQVTVPIDVRRRLGLVTGSRVDFQWRDGEYVLVSSSKPVSRLAGFFGPHEGPPVSLEQMEADLADAMGAAA